MNIVIIGHVDHGKSTLIGRLLYDTNSIPEALVEDVRNISKELGKEMEFSYLLDSLEEERAQNITIDTTQTFFSSPKRDYVIIDAPGHREFLKNMITGASAADAAVLIVDVSLGMQEQTKRHAYIANLLGIEHLIVVLNKMDSVEYSKEAYEKAREDVTAFLAKFNIKPQQVIPLSAKNGDNVAKYSERMPWYDGTSLVEALDNLSLQNSQSAANLRFPIQDLYRIDEKDIYVGRIEQGEVNKGDKITVYPSNVSHTVKSIEVWNAKKDRALAGESIGVVFEGDPKLTRGDVVCSGEKPGLTEKFEATVFWMSPNPVKVNEKIILKCATQEIPCTLETIKTKINSSSLDVLATGCADLAETEVAEVVIKTDRPVVIENFNQVESLGRFVLVRNDEIDGGGIIR